MRYRFQVDVEFHEPLKNAEEGRLAGVAIEALAALLPQIEQLLLERTGRSIAQLQLLEGTEDAGLISHSDETDPLVQQLPRS